MGFLTLAPGTIILPGSTQTPSGPVHINQWKSCQEVPASFLSEDLWIQTANIWLWILTSTFRTIWPVILISNKIDIFPVKYKVTRVPGASMGNLARGKGQEEGGLTKRKGGIRPQGSLWIFSSIYYRNQSLPALLCYAFHLLV